MSSKSYVRLLHLSPGLLTGLLALRVLTASASLLPAVTDINALTVQKPVVSATNQPVPATSDAPSLDNRHLFALGMIETGNDDHAIGSAGEISRFQLSPSVWKSYSKSEDYVNPSVAVEVARQHWSYLAAYFKEKAGHTPTDFDMYVLWNTRYGYYARNHFSQRQISPLVKDRASRFVNLVNRPELARK